MITAMKPALTCILFFYSVYSFAQNDSVKKEPSFRVWVNPIQALAGQYTLSFAWRMHKKIDWFEIVPGYRYFLFGPQELHNALGGTLATPDFGVRFYGPSLSFSYDKYYVKIKKSLRETLETD